MPPAAATTARAPARRRPRRKKGSPLVRGLRRWRKRAGAAWRWLAATSPPLRIVLGAAAVLVLLVLAAAANLVYQVALKPTEMLFPVSGVLDKAPDETWRSYAKLFRDNATAAVPAELLAALAQVEGAGNPVAHTYWRLRFSWHPLQIYRPASTAVGMYQMTDPAFAEARRHCIRGHRVVDDGPWDDWRSCWFTALYTRILPSHAVELAAVNLDRAVTAVLARRPGAKPGARQLQDLAALVHLCGPGPAESFARNGFQLDAGALCGDHDPALYLARVDAMARQFRRLGAL